MVGTSVGDSVALLSSVEYSNNSASSSMNTTGPSVVHTTAPVLPAAAVVVLPASEEGSLDSSGTVINMWLQS